MVQIGVGGGGGGGSSPNNVVIQLDFSNKKVCWIKG